MRTKNVEYIASDCLPIKNKKNDREITEVSDKFLSSIQSIEDVNFISITNQKQKNDKEPIVSFKDGKWIAGRYVGYIKSNKYILNISPRFGNSVIKEMFGEISNHVFINNSSGLDEKNNSFFLKKVIFLLWISKFEKANRHGLPRTYTKRTNKGNDIKGKLLVNQSIIDYKTKNVMSYQYYESDFDKKILCILKSAYNILKKDCDLDVSNFSFNIKKLLFELNHNCQDIDCLHISENDYHSISYNPIYFSYKDLVDFSWQIIKHSTGIDILNKNNNSYGMFIDMAEVWECYIRKIVSDYLSFYGWRIINEKYKTYENLFYKREIIPDMIFEKDKSYCIFDAKYKKMEYKKNDVDREDYFQIHTYISYFQHHGNVKCAGLFYPIKEQSFKDIVSISSLFGDNSKCKFIIDGPYINDDNIDKERFYSLLKKIIR